MGGCAVPAGLAVLVGAAGAAAAARRRRRPGRPIIRPSARPSPRPCCSSFGGPTRVVGVVDGAKAFEGAGQTGRGKGGQGRGGRNGEERAGRSRAVPGRRPPSQGGLPRRWGDCPREWRVLQAFGAGPPTDRNISAGLDASRRPLSQAQGRTSRGTVIVSSPPPPPVKWCPSRLVRTRSTRPHGLWAFGVPLPQQTQDVNLPCAWSGVCAVWVETWQRAF